MKTALIIPAYKPGEALLALLARFRENDAFLPVVVDDGSGEAFRPIFDAVPPGVALLRHPENRGKGAALKTAMRYVLDHCPECDLALTADADGQHRYEDILKVCETARRRPDALVLGSRQFEGTVPLRSRFGNAVTRRVFAIVSGAKVFDTQTGLRAFGREAMARFCEVSGERYEYEINVLLSAAQAGIPIVEEKIETVYLDDNASSHFNPFRDSLKIYLCILKFGASSILAFIIDFIMVLLLSALTRSLPKADSLRISVIGARLVSATVNFTVNRRVVFKGNESLLKSVVKYAALAACILAAKTALMHVLTILWNWPLIPANIVIETALFCVNFTVQGKFVYRKKTAEGK